MQSPPPNQQSYGTPVGTSPPQAPKTGSGLEPNIAAALSYIWIVGVIFYLMEKENAFIRFHAMQSILFGIANTVIMMLLVIVGMVLTFAFGIGGAMVGGGVSSLASLLIWLIWLLFWLIGIALFATLIVAAVKAYQGAKFKLPIIGNMAERIANK
ncbi:MAG TPA: DUF4870 domain-containing protein [Pyrinomonadaceae bacterium]|nr:DUF4870 domain-containing protein [Pyrinomonadaceae bacterium]